MADSLLRTLADERGRWLLGGDHLAAKCEFPITGLADGELVNGRLDPAFVDRQGTRWIVDYKTSAHEGAGLEDFLDNECERYRPQLELYRQMFAGLEDRPIQAGLYFPLLQRWCEITDTRQQGLLADRSVQLVGDCAFVSYVILARRQMKIIIGES